jgi:hypothetical protein
MVLTAREEIALQRIVGNGMADEQPEQDRQSCAPGMFSARKNASRAVSGGPIHTSITRNGIGAGVNGPP